nr:NAD(+)/NADH kinase [uncultured Agathobacter sp.]
MKHFVLITNAYKDKDFKLSNKIIDYICKKGGTAKSLISNVESTDNRDFSIDEIPKDTECILVLGGDGTLIRAATKVGTLQIPLMGVNLGTLGYLCEVEEATVYDAVDSLMNDKYMTENRIMLTGCKRGSSDPSVALNDIVIHRAGDLQILSLKVYVNGEFLNNYHADGIIVATPTGSTGYNMSAGGPIVDPKGDMLLLTPINAHNLNSKSIVLSGDDVVEIEVCSRRIQKDEKACVSFDGDTNVELCVGDRFEIAKAANYTKVCKLHKRSFLEILRKKMETYA